MRHTRGDYVCQQRTTCAMGAWCPWVEWPCGLLSPASDWVTHRRTVMKIVPSTPPGLTPNPNDQWHPNLRQPINPQSWTKWGEFSRLRCMNHFMTRDTATTLIHYFANPDQNTGSITPHKRLLQMVTSKQILICNNPIYSLRYLFLKTSFRASNRTPLWHPALVNDTLHLDHPIGWLRPREYATTLDSFPGSLP